MCCRCYNKILELSRGKKKINLPVTSTKKLSIKPLRGREEIEDHHSLLDLFDVFVCNNKSHCMSIYLVDIRSVQRLQYSFSLNCPRLWCRISIGLFFSYVDQYARMPDRSQCTLFIFNGSKTNFCYFYDYRARTRASRICDNFIPRSEDNVAWVHSIISIHSGHWFGRESRSSLSFSTWKA